MIEVPELNLSNVEASTAFTPCHHCESIVPDRRKCDDGAKIWTQYNRIDIFPEFPGLRASADAGCRFCGFLQKELSSEAFSEIESGTALASWASPNPSWDRRVSIKIRFECLPFTPLSGGNNFHISGVSPQYNAVVADMIVDYKSLSRDLRGKDNRAWDGSTVDLSISDSPGTSTPRAGLN